MYSPFLSYIFLPIFHPTPLFLPLPSNFITSFQWICHNKEIFNLIKGPSTYGVWVFSWVLSIVPLCLITYQRWAPLSWRWDDILVTCAWHWILCSMGRFPQVIALCPWLVLTFVWMFCWGGVLHLGCFIIRSASISLSWTKTTLNRPKLFRGWAYSFWPTHKTQATTNHHDTPSLSICAREIDEREENITKPTTTSQQPPYKTPKPHATTHQC